jgi:hypothetical protein
MTRTVSVITPVHRAGVEYLPEAAASLATQQLPRGWDWEWLIQEDGDGVGASGYVPDDPRIHVESSRRGGPHIARTVALGRSQGDFIKTLDADDLLTEGTLARDIAALERNPAAGWTTSAVQDLMPDGRLLAFEGDPPEGLIQSGSVLAHWEIHRRPQVHPATLCARRPLVLALGGWMALPSSGDTGLLLGLDALGPGYFSAKVGLHYRKHEAQITTHANHAAGREWEARMRVIGERALALRTLMQRSVEGAA